MIQSFINLITYLFKWSLEPIPTNPMPPVPASSDLNNVVQPLPAPEVQTPAQRLYSLSRSLLGQHLSLNEAVPWMVGCMEAVSKLLVQFGTPGIPKAGIEGTAAGLAFLIQSPHFKEITAPQLGAILIAATGTGNGKIRGHVGCIGEYQIMSNNSETGKWDTQWTIDRWLAYYDTYGGIKTRYFLPI